jgi:hypothetical protein
MQSRASMNAQCALSGRHSNARTCQASKSKHGQASSCKSLVALARAVRPASLAASAMAQRLEAGTQSTFGAALEAQDEQVQPIQGRSASRPSVAQRKQVSIGSTRPGMPLQMQALRRSAKPNTTSRAATSFARGGGFGLFARGATQRTMRAGSVPHSALPNPSINRTSPGKPGAACYLKR